MGPQKNSVARDITGKYPGTYLDKYIKYTISYSSFFLQNNQIYIIVSTELPQYHRTFTQKLFVPRVILSNKISLDNVPRDIPGTRPGKHSP